MSIESKVLDSIRSNYSNSDFDPEFIEYLMSLPLRPRVGNGHYINIHECVRCPLIAHGCMFGAKADQNIKLGQTKLSADMCAYRNGFHVVRSQYGFIEVTSEEKNIF